MRFPLFYYPTTISVLDDDYHFLDTLTQAIQNYGYDVRRFYDDKSLINALSVKEGEEFIRSACCSSEEVKYGIHTSIFCLNKFPFIIKEGKPKLNSIVFVDYSMPFGSGIDVLKNIDNDLIKKALLTGIADEKIATQAFNEGVIDNYLKKQSEKLHAQIYEVLLNLTWNYFLGLSENISSTLEDYSKILGNKKLSKYLFNLIKKGDITSYCLLSLDGLFLLKDKNEEFIILKIVLDSDLEIVNASESNFSETEKEKIRSKEKALIFFDQGAYKLPEENVKEYLFDVMSEEGFFYALAPLSKFNQESFFGSK